MAEKHAAAFDFLSSISLKKSDPIRDIPQEDEESEKSEKVEQKAALRKTTLNFKPIQKPPADSDYLKKFSLLVS